MNLVSLQVDNIIQYNLGVFTKSHSSLLNVDQTPGTFWIVNPDNYGKTNMLFFLGHSHNRCHFSSFLLSKGLVWEMNGRILVIMMELYRAIEEIN